MCSCTHGYPETLHSFRYSLYVVPNPGSHFYALAPGIQMNTWWMEKVYRWTFKFYFSVLEKINYQSKQQFCGFLNLKLGYFKIVDLNKCVTPIIMQVACWNIKKSGKRQLLDIQEIILATRACLWFQLLCSPPKATLPPMFQTLTPRVAPLSLTHRLASDLAPSSWNLFWLSRKAAPHPWYPLV